MSTSTTSSSGMPSNEILYPRKTHCLYLPNEIRNQEWVRRDSYQGCCHQVLFFLNVTVHLICVHQIQTKNLLLTQSSSIKLTQKPIGRNAVGFKVLEETREKGKMPEGKLRDKNHWRAPPAAPREEYICKGLWRIKC